MWLAGQNLNQPRTDKSGSKWNFRVWHDVVDLRHVSRIFFWDEKGEVMGVVLYPADANTDISRLRSMIQKLVADPHVRAKYQRKLRFPLERHYSAYGAFPEESRSH